MARIPTSAPDSLLSRYAFGTGRLYKGSFANIYDTIRRAYDLGIRHFDSSVGYGNAAPHAALGQLVRDVGEEDLFISTKVGHFRSTFPQYKELYRNEGALWGIIHECHRMLRGKVDLLQIHEADLSYWWNPNEPADGHTFLTESVGLSDVPSLADAPMVRALTKAKEAGICRYTGVTGNSSGPLATVAGELEIDSVMCAYNLDPIFRGTLETVAPVARDKDLFLMAAGMLQGGNYRNPLDLPESFRCVDGVAERFRTFAEIQKESGLDAVEILIRWTHSVKGVHRWVLGASRPEQVEQTVEILNRGPLPADLQSSLDDLGLHGLDWRVVLSRQRAG